MISTATRAEVRRALKVARKANPVNSGLIKGMKPKRRLTLSQWAEEYMRLSPESSAEPGPFRIGDAAYQRGMLDAITDRRTKDVVIMTSAQVGKTTVLRAALGYYIEREPSPILCVLPSDKIASTWSQDFVDPMIRDSPILQRCFKTSAKLGRSQTALKKAFPGGTMTIVGANVPSNLASKPIRVILADEVDKWAKTAGKAGDPVALATMRTTTFKDVAKRIWVSTPLLEETSSIAAMYKNSDQRHFHVPCYECGHFQHLVWQNVRYDKGKEKDAVYMCEECGCMWTELKKRAAVRKGVWVAHNPGNPTVGFHINQIYSPMSNMHAMAEACKNAKGNPTKESQFWNEGLGLPFSGALAASASAEALRSRKEDIVRGRLAATVALLTAGVDIQRDRIEIMVWGWGPDEEGWVVDHHVIHGDPSGVRIWADLEQWLLRSYAHPMGGQLGIEAVAVDSGDGFSTQAVYDFCGKAQGIGRLWYAIKGVEFGPIWSRSKQSFKNPLFKLYLIGTADAKSNLYGRYGTVAPGPAYVHIPEWLPDDIIEQMTSEYCQVEYNEHGFPITKWKNKDRARNEGLDMSVYAYAVHKSLDLDLAFRLRSWAARDEKRLDPKEIGSLFKKSS